MALCGVADVFRKAIFRILGFVRTHERIAVRFCEDGCCGDRSRYRIALDDGFLRDSDAFQNQCVDQKKIGGKAETGDGVTHCQLCRFKDIYSIDLFRTYGTDRVGEADLFQLGSDLVTLLTGQLF